MDTDLVEFRQLQEVGIFSYFVYSLSKSHFMDGDLNRMEKIPTCVAVNSANPRISLFT